MDAKAADQPLRLSQLVLLLATSVVQSFGETAPWKQRHHLGFDDWAETKGLLRLPLCCGHCTCESFIWALMILHGFSSLPNCFLSRR